MLYYYNNETGEEITISMWYTSYGGDTLPIEVSFYKANGNLVLTGSLGDGPS